jgi:hypothetical protein
MLKPSLLTSQLSWFFSRGLLSEPESQTRSADTVVTVSSSSVFYYFIHYIRTCSIPTQCQHRVRVGRQKCAVEAPRTRKYLLRTCIGGIHGAKPLFKK